MLMSGRKEFTLEELAKFTQSQLIGNPQYVVKGYADLENAEPHEVSFLSNPKYTNTRYENLMKSSRAGIIFIAPHVKTDHNKNYLIHEDPSRAFQMAVEAFQGQRKNTFITGIHQSAVIDESAIIGQGVSIGPHAVIEAGVVIGNHCMVGAGCYLGPNTHIGESCIFHPNVTIRENCIIGNQVILQSGVVIGSCGFGYTTNKQGVHEQLTHVGNVILEDDVEIGANSTVDRARFTSTVVGKGTKIDNLVVIGHNVKIGKHNIICGQSAIAGSSQTGDHVVIAGQCGISGHIKLENEVIVTAKSGVAKSLPKGRYGGIPAQSLEKHNRTNVHIRNLEKYASELNKLKAKFKELAENLNKLDCPDISK